MSKNMDKKVNDTFRVVQLIAVALDMHKVKETSEFAAIMGTVIKAWCDMHNIKAGPFLTALTMSMVDAESELDELDDLSKLGSFDDITLD